jgi:hypothetical protein
VLWRRSRDIRKSCSLCSLNAVYVSSIRQALYSTTMSVYKAKKNRRCSCVTSSSPRTSTTQSPSVRAPACTLPLAARSLTNTHKSRGDRRAHAGRQVNEDIQFTSIHHSPRIPNNARTKHRPSPPRTSPPVPHLPLVTNLSHTATGRNTGHPQRSAPSTHRLEPPQNPILLRTASATRCASTVDADTERYGRYCAGCGDDGECAGCG